MARNRVFSFISQFSANREPSSPTGGTARENSVIQSPPASSPVSSFLPSFSPKTRRKAATISSSTSPSFFGNLFPQNLRPTASSSVPTPSDQSQQRPQANGSPNTSDNIVHCPVQLPTPDANLVAFEERDLRATQTGDGGSNSNAESPAARPGISRSRSRASTFIFNNSDNPRRQSRPLSMFHAYQPSTMETQGGVIPELLPIYTLLNTHSSKLYQEGYFLKLDDQNIRGQTNPDRSWTECFAQLVGTVLSLWDAAELDAAGDRGDVLPKFINLTDASLHIIDSLPTNSPNANDQPLQNILSISTAGRNRYLLYFNSLSSLQQWTAGIRLALYEHISLQEAYTGALIAGKAKSLNNINLIMDHTRGRLELWVRARFGPGTPWRRCFCVIIPPDEKEVQRVQKEWKRKSLYDRSNPPAIKGEIRFYDTRVPLKKQKKITPLATIKDSHSAYAIYPQSKALVDASTLIKIEGNITYYLDPPSSKEGFLFVMPEVPPAVSGFEMLLRFLFPTWDTFHLYGRPGRLVASVLDQRCLMFAMPKHKRYGYLDVDDVATLVATNGSDKWSEQEWRKKLKDLTSTRMQTIDDMSSNSGSRTNLASPPIRPKVNFSDSSGSARSGRSMTVSQPGPSRFASSSPAPAGAKLKGHSRNSSEPVNVPILPKMSSYASTSSPLQLQPAANDLTKDVDNDKSTSPEVQSSEEDLSHRAIPPDIQDVAADAGAPAPVTAPPALARSSHERPSGLPQQVPETMLPKKRLSQSTLTCMLTPMVEHVQNPFDSAMSQQVRQNARGPSPHAPPRFSSSQLSIAHPPEHTLGSMTNSGANRGNEDILSTSSVLGGGGYQNFGNAQQRPVSFVGSSQNGVTDRKDLQISARPPERTDTMAAPVSTSQHNSRFTNNTTTTNEGSIDQLGPSASISGHQRTHSLANSSCSAISFDHTLASLVIDPASLDGVVASDNLPQAGPAPSLQHPSSSSAALSANAKHMENGGGSEENGPLYSPSYASTIRSSTSPKLARLEDRPRAGVLRIVGGRPNALDKIDMPKIDFGPTYNIASEAGFRAAASNLSSQPELGGESHVSVSGPEVKHSHGTQANAGNTDRPGNSHDSPSKAKKRPDSMFPLDASRRSSSGNLLTMANVSRAALLRHRQRSSSMDAANLLKVSSSLSAREQEQIARLTGSSLLDVRARRQSETQGAGLVGAIAHREREKHHMRQSYGQSSQTVQNIIAQRQQLAAQQQLAQQQAAQQQAAYQLQLQQYQQNLIGQQMIQAQHHQPQQVFAPSGLYHVANSSSPSILGGLTRPNAYRASSYGGTFPVVQHSATAVAPIYIQGGYASTAQSNIPSHPSGGRMSSTGFSAGPGTIHF